MENSTILVLLLITIIAIISTTSFCSANIDVLCNESERQALLAFKEDLEDPMNSLSNWVGNNGDCCSWTGVACNSSTGHVHELHLGSQDGIYGLSGKINPVLQELKHLQHLDLSGNNFGGIQIPSFIGSIQRLSYLNLSYSGFGGTIPHQLGNLSSLRYLNFGNCIDLKVENLQWISGLSSLQYLEMTQVNLSKAYDWLQVINMLSYLQELHLSSCELTHFSPLSIINSTSLVTLDLSFNHLGGHLMPLWLCSLINLESLSLASNSFKDLYGLANLTRLKILDMSRNPFNSIIPSWMSGFKHLEYLYLSECDLKGSITNAIANLSSIMSLDLSWNQLEGNLPDSLGHLCKLRELNLHHNNFSGAISETTFTRFSKCTVHSMETLNLHHNQISGQLPESLGKLSSLQELDISHNLFNGNLPENVGQLFILESLDISHNLLQGVVNEVHFFNLTRLKSFNAEGNSLIMKTSPYWIPPFQLEELNLNGWHLGQQLPLWIQWQRNLTELQLSNTGISGTIPSWFCNFSLLQLPYLNLSHNKLHGEFPCTNLSFGIIDLSSNQFNGSLPLVSSKIRIVDFSNNSFFGSIFHFFCDVDYQKSTFFGFGPAYVNLGNNLLFGEIPDCLMKWEDLRILNLENNNLSGVIPSSIGHLTFLSWFKLRNNSLHGEAPKSLKKCINLMVLDLSENKFSGKIPKWIWTSFSTLVVLNLRSNEFLGEIPSQLCSLTYLQILDLSHNLISGTIPRCLYKLIALTTLVQPQNYPSLTYGFPIGQYKSMAEVMVVTKGIEAEYSTILHFVKSMDLSSNNLYGDIPVEITSLQLQMLNLSNNHLVGKIPSNIGDMRWLESLDLSNNHLSGTIPPSISHLNFLSYLNLSFNNLVGTIPTSTQLQSFNESSFIGNKLCGPPSQQNCFASDPEIPDGDKQGHDEDSLQDDIYLYLFLALGFAFGFLGVLASLLVNVPWNLAFCSFLDRIVLKIYFYMF